MSSSDNVEHVCECRILIQDTVVNKMWRSIILCYGDECHTALTWWIGAKLICMQPSISTGCYRHGMLVREIRRQGKVRSIFFESIVSTGMEDSKWVVIFLRSVFSWGNCVTFIFILAHTHTQWNAIEVNSSLSTIKVRNQTRTETN